HRLRGRDPVRRRVFRLPRLRTLAHLGRIFRSRSPQVKSSGLRALLIGSLAALAGCSSVVVVRKAETRTFSEPAYARRQQFYFWGLVEGQTDLFVDKVCLGKPADQVLT